MTGVLPVTLEESRKIVQALLLSGKEYVCLMKLHGDVEEKRVRDVLKEFEDTIYQRPPLRASVKRQLRTRRIYYIDFLEMDGRNVLFKVGCEGGTYIRKLCVSGDTEIILCNGGIRKIRELNGGARISDLSSGNFYTVSMNQFTLESAKITRAYSLPSPNKLVRITTESGISVKVTPDHEVLVSTVEGPMWVPACSLKVGDFIFSPRKIPVEGFSPYIVDLLNDETYVVDQKIRELCIKGIKDKFGSIREMNRRLKIDRKPFHSGSKIGIKIKYVKSFCDWNESKELISAIKTEKGKIIRLYDKKVTPELMYLLGLIASDGCIIWDKRCIRPARIKFHNSNKKLIDNFIEVYNKIFPDVPARVKPFRDNIMEVDAHNTVLANIAYSLGIRSPEKYMDLNGIFTLSEELIKSFLKGYFDGDGMAYIKKMGKRTCTIIEYCTGFQLIAKRLYQLLKRLGIRSKIFRRKRCGCFKNEEGFAYSIRLIDPIDKLRFIKEVGSNHSEKESRLQLIKEHLEKGKATSLEHVPLHANKLLEFIFTKNNLKGNLLKLGGNFYRTLNSKKPMTKHLLGLVIKSLSKHVKKDEIEPLLQILHSDFYVERVKSVESIKSEEDYVYDVTVENTHNFIPECAIVISNCFDIGEVLGCGAHMQELRRTRAGPFTEEEGNVTLHDVAYWFMQWQEKGDDAILKKFIHPMEKALALVPKIYIRDSAVDAVCHGANLTAPGVLSLETGIGAGAMVAIFTLKGEAVALAEAQASTEEILSMEHGVVAKVKRVLMPRGTYPKCWKSGEI